MADEAQLADAEAPPAKVPQPSLDVEVTEITDGVGGAKADHDDATATATVTITHSDGAAAGNTTATAGKDESRPGTEHDSAREKASEAENDDVGSISDLKNESRSASKPTTAHTNKPTTAGTIPGTAESAGTESTNPEEIAAMKAKLAAKNSGAKRDSGMFMQDFATAFDEETEEEKRDRLEEERELKIIENRKARKAKTMTSASMVSLGAKKKWVSLDSFDPRSAHLNSPRSLEACYRHGIEPKDLCYVDKKAMKEANRDLSPKRLAMRYDYFEQRREEKLNLVKAERAAIVKRKDELYLVNKKPLQEKSSVSPQKSNPVMAKEHANQWLREEEKAIGLIKEKQKREVERLVENELKTAKMMDDRAAFEKDEARKKEALIRKRIQRQQEQYEIAQRRAEEKAMMMEEERQAIQRRLLTDQRAQAAKDMEEKEAREKRHKDMKTKEVELRKRQIMFMDRLEAIREDEEKRIVKQIKKMEARENERVKAITIQRREEARMVEAKRLEAEERLKLVQEEQKRKLSAQVTSIEKKRAIGEERTRRLKEEKNEEIALKREYSISKEKQRQEQFERSRHAEESKTMSLIETQKQKERHLDAQKNHLHKSFGEKMERRVLTHIAKKDNVARKQKLDSVIRERLADRIKERQYKIDNFVLSRNQLLQRRQIMREQARQKREHIKKVMHQFNVTKDIRLLNVLTEDESQKPKTAGPEGNRPKKKKVANRSKTVQGYNHDDDDGYFDLDADP